MKTNVALLLVLLLCPASAMADEIDELIERRESCLAACDAERRENPTCPSTCPRLTPAAERRRAGVAPRSERCAGVTATVTDTDGIAAQTAYQDFETTHARLRDGAAEDPLFEGLRENQISGIHASLADSGPIGRALSRRTAENAAPAGSPRYLAERRRIVFQYQHNLTARLDRLGVPANHALRTHLDGVFSAFRRTSYTHMQHAECTYRRTSGVAVSETLVPAEEAPPIESETPAVDPAVIDAH
jgi:hypothetical protein